MGDLSEHFSKREFSCRCCGHLVISGRLLLALEHLRELVGLPIKVHDGYRCASHNEHSGGVTDSEQRGAPPWTERFPACRCRKCMPTR